MAELNVRIEELPRMWVASVLAMGRQPEPEAWERLRAWADPRGLLDDIDRHPVFGFNNPNPSPDREEYGYELWIRVEAAGEGGGPVVYKEFEGGLFAVASCKLQEVPATWHALWNWAQTAPYRWRKAQELERALNPDAPADEMTFELYLPVQQAAAYFFG